MHDLISRQAAIDALEKHEKSKGHNYSMFVDVVCECAEIIRDLPSEQPDIVRCKDCKHLFDGEHNANCCEVLMEKAKWLTEITVDMNWYCADGERRTEEEKNDT